MSDAAGSSRAFMAGAIRHRAAGRHLTLISGAAA
jgi:hypothetical protein